MRVHSTLISFSLVAFALSATIGCSDSEPTTVVPDEGDPVIVTVSSVNEYCPIMGGKITEEGGTVLWKDQTIGFCCDGCDEKFLALSDEEKSSKLQEAIAKSESGSGHEGHDHDHDDDEQAGHQAGEPS